MQVLPNDLIRIKENKWLFAIKKDELCPLGCIGEKTSLLCSVLTDEVNLHLIADNFRIAYIAANIIKNLAKENQNILDNPLIFKLLNRTALAGKWRIETQVDNSTFFNRFWQSIPFTRTLEDKSIFKVNITKCDDSFYTKLNELIKENLLTLEGKTILIRNEFDIARTYFHFTIREPIVNKLIAPEFDEPFTKIASEAFQRHEKKLIYPKEPNGSLRIVLRGNRIQLDSHNEEPLPMEQEENRLTIRAYKRHLLQEYGQELIEYVSFRHKINLDTMIQEGSPLFAEHIFRFNIGMHNIEMQTIENLYNNLSKLYESIRSQDLSFPAISFWNLESHKLSNSPLHLREFRALFNKVLNHQKKTALSELNLKDIISYLDSSFSFGLDTAGDLPVRAFNELISFYSLDNKHIYTGKKIIHKAIMGYYVTADPSFFQPWQDLQELTQVFNKLEKPDDWISYYELLSHVVVKKHLLKKHPIEEWRVGGLIPAPKTQDGEPRWYRIESCTDDAHGDFNYTLIKACQNYSNLPAIKLYRSTASDKYAMRGQGSINADLQIARAPGAASRDEADEYEIPFFHDRTIPVWIGYFLKAQKLFSSKLLAQGSFQEKTALLHQIVHDLTLSIEVYEKQLKIPNNEKSQLPSNVSDKNYRELLELANKFLVFLENKGEELKELPKYKIAEDISFVGHSLGGSLAQGGLYHFGPHMNRIPLHGKSYTCYASDAPAITSDESKIFFDFGIKHQNLLGFLKQKWKIYLQFEYGDPAPLLGEVHIGSTTIPSEKYTNWLSITNVLFKPLETATAQEIVTNPTHGRRIGFAKEGKDYDLYGLSPEELYEYNTSWWLNPKLRSIFGYRFANSPVLSETIRRIVSLVHNPLQQISEIFNSNNEQNRGKEYSDNFGNFHVSYNKLILNASA